MRELEPEVAAVLLGRRCENAYEKSCVVRDARLGQARAANPAMWDEVSRLGNRVFEL
jgi:hypothetical protein